LKENFGGNGMVSRRLSIDTKVEKQETCGQKLKTKKQAVSVEK